jgi:hypothetical protein
LRTAFTGLLLLRGCFGSFANSARSYARCAPDMNLRSFVAATTITVLATVVLTACASGTGDPKLHAARILAEHRRRRLRLPRGVGRHSADA